MSEWGTAAGLVPIVVVVCHLLGVLHLAACLAWLKELSNVEDLLGCLVVLPGVSWRPWPLLGLPWSSCWGHRDFFLPNWDKCLQNYGILVFGMWRFVY